MAMFKALNAVNLLRVSKAGEIEGFDLDQHGAAAYPEFVISTRTAGRAVDADLDDRAGMPSAQAAGAE